MVKLTEIMQPTLPPNYQAPLPADYLDQIAPQHIKHSGPVFSIRNLVIAAVIIIFGLTFGTMVLSGIPKNTEILAARLTATKDVSEKATNNIRNTQLRAVNGNLKLLLTNTLRDIKPLLAKVDVDISELSPSIVADEATTELEAKLEDARLNAVYDRAYAREMSYKLETILSLMKQTYKNTSNSELKTFLNDAYENLQKIQQSFADFNATNG